MKFKHKHREKMLEKMDKKMRRFRQFDDRG
jgi:hypothetical protein